MILHKSNLESGYVSISSSHRLDDSRSSPPEGDKYLSDHGLQSVVGCGYPKSEDDVELIIVNPDDLSTLPEDRVGEIWVNSPSKAMGYWDQPALSKDEFNAIPSSHNATQSMESKGYLRTGDLGFMHQGEVFICGRSKDLIIVRGSNHYPQDIERTAEKAEPRLRPGCSAAFSLSSSILASKGNNSNSNSNSSHTESVVFVAELKTGDGMDSSPATLENVTFFSFYFFHFKIYLNIIIIIIIIII